MMPYKKRILFFLGLTLLLLACGLPGLEDGYLNLNFEIDESRFEDMMRDGTFNVNNQNVFDEINDVEFSDGQIHVTGTRNGVEGYFDFTISAADNQLQVAIIDYEMAGLELDIDQLNEQLATSLAGASGQSGEVEWTNVEVTDDAIVMDIRVRVVQEDQ
ncbi:MAG: hypothetical protein KDE09_23310 [Anaerolineales bacterium]|nr:hypothetical protein [Anaerolineales bacterium]MCB0014898.1 hypothetical protein [Anaerolineales bacterium]MCB0020750.1 hypothetical protein [Anaerolineales bacterium]